MVHGVYTKLTKTFHSDRVTPVYTETPHCKAYQSAVKNADNGSWPSGRYGCTLLLTPAGAKNTTNASRYTTDKK